ncbi:hypothetical protein PR202_ga29924 [Eleusine coracana subsp. coracana]|uniref:Uncharacterized protein n=1 Tax=Eleusine coracana subsp. coracana TaxID=191504 RepID=A0AAV5DNK6_ELECO|nr:hypothetical protein PR202_ga29924 [Eleusine coracana subsp. coracana]
MVGGDSPPMDLPDGGGKDKEVGSACNISASYPRSSIRLVLSSGALFITPIVSSIFVGSCRWVVASSINCFNSCSIPELLWYAFLIASAICMLKLRRLLLGRQSGRRKRL